MSTLILAHLQSVQANWIHLIWFIRDAALERLVSSLKYPPFYTRSVSYSSLIFWTNSYSLSLISYQPQKKLPTTASQYLKMSVMHGEIFEYWIWLSFHIKVQCCVQTHQCRNIWHIPHHHHHTQHHLLPTKLQVVSPILQISVISYFYRGD